MGPGQNPTAHPCPLRWRGCVLLTSTPTHKNESKKTQHKNNIFVFFNFFICFFLFHFCLLSFFHFFIFSTFCRFYVFSFSVFFFLICFVFLLFFSFFLNFFSFFLFFLLFIFSLSDHVGRTRLAKSCGSRDDSLSWNLSRVKQGGAIRADDMDHKTERAGRAVCHTFPSAR